MLITLRYIVQLNYRDIQETVTYNTHRFAYRKKRHNNNDTDERYSTYKIYLLESR